MTVYEYAQEWVWRFSKATGIPKYVFLAISRHFKRTQTGEFLTPSLPVEDIVASTGMSDATVRRSIETLEQRPDGEIEVVRSGRRGTVNRYRLRRELKLPLMDIDPSAQRSNGPMTPLTESDAPPLRLNIDTAQADLCDRAVRPVASVTETGAEPKDPFFSEVVRTEVPTTTKEAADTFLGWFVAEYPKHRGGVQCHVANRLKAMQVVRELLDGRGLARVQAMAIAMWQDTAEPWLNNARNDRSVYSLLTKATYLEQVVVAQQPKPDSRGHLPPCRTNGECIERVLREGREATG